MAYLVPISGLIVGLLSLIVFVIGPTPGIDFSAISDNSLSTIGR